LRGILVGLAAKKEGEQIIMGNNQQEFLYLKKQVEEIQNLLHENNRQAYISNSRYFTLPLSLYIS
jgi:hypothetical protein